MKKLIIAALLIVFFLVNNFVAHAQVITSQQIDSLTELVLKNF